MLLPACCCNDWKCPKSAHSNTAITQIWIFFNQPIFIITACIVMCPHSPGRACNINNSVTVTANRGWTGYPTGNLWRSLGQVIKGQMLFAEPNQQCCGTQRTQSIVDNNGKSILNLFTTLFSKASILRQPKNIMPPTPSTGLSDRVVSASDCGVRGPRFKSRRWRLCLLRQLLRYTVLSTGCTP